MIAAALVLGAAAAVAPLPHTRSGHGPGIVLVHGLGGDRHVWDDVAAKLASELTVIAVDLPGHGAAPAPSAHLDADQHRGAHRCHRATRRSWGRRSSSATRSAATSWPTRRRPTARALVLVDIGIGKLWTPKEIDEMRARLAKDRDGTLQSWFGAIMQAGAQLERMLARRAQAVERDARRLHARMMATQPTPPAEADADGAPDGVAADLAGQADAGRGARRRRLRRRQGAARRALHDVEALASSGTSRRSS